MRFDEGSTGMLTCGGHNGKSLDVGSKADVPAPAVEAVSDIEFAGVSGLEVWPELENKSVSVTGVPVTLVADPVTALGDEGFSDGDMGTSNGAGFDVGGSLSSMTGAGVFGGSNGGPGGILCGDDGSIPEANSTAQARITAASSDGGGGGTSCSMPFKDGGSMGGADGEIGDNREPGFNPPKGVVTDRGVGGWKAA